MTQKTRLDDLIEFVAPHKRLKHDIVRRTDAHQYLTYVTTHYDPCVLCVYAQECPPCPYEVVGRRTTPNE